MDCAAPYVGDGPCCSVKCTSSFTPTMAEGQMSSQAKQDATQILYESDALISRYLSLHYGPQDQVYSLLGQINGGSISSSLLDTPVKRAVDQLTAWMRKGSAAASALLPDASGRKLRALDLGCAVGRGTFELALAPCTLPGSPSPLFSEVVGVDLSARFIEVAVRMKERHQMDYDLKVEGEILERAKAALPTHPPGSSWEEACERCRFIRGDACSLSSLKLDGFDAVLASDLLDSVPEPLTLLREIHGAMTEGGVLLLSSPFAWSDKFTSRDNWIGGTRRDGEPERSVTALQRVTEEIGFEVIAEEQAVPTLIPMDGRSFELKVLYSIVLRKVNI